MAVLSSSDSVKYYGAFTSQNGTARQWEIRENGYDWNASGKTSLVSVGRDSCTTHWYSAGDDEYEPIMGSETTIRFYDNSVGAVLADMFAASGEVDGKYAIAITEGGTLKWIGYVNPEDLIYNEDGPAILEISASCGLGKLETSTYNLNTTTAITVSWGRVTAISIIADILDTLPWGMGFYTATDLRPKKDAPQLTYDVDPLGSIYLRKEAFSVKARDLEPGEYYKIRNPVSKLSVLRVLCMAFGMQVYQGGDGYWHLEMSNKRAQTSFRRWEYNAAGALQGQTLHTAGITVASGDDASVRSPATITALPTYSAAMVQYNHGVVNIIENPSMIPDELNYVVPYAQRETWAKLNGAEYWQRGKGREDFEMSCPDAGWQYDWIGKTGAQIGTWMGGKAYAAQGSDTFIPAGEQLLVMGNFMADGGDKADGWEAGNDVGIFLQVYVVAEDSPFNKYYLTLDSVANRATGSWSAANSEQWIVLTNGIVIGDWQTLGARQDAGFRAILTDALPETGKVWIILGPTAQRTGTEIKRVASANTAVTYCSAAHWDNVDVEILMPGGDYNVEATNTVNFISRDTPRVRELVLPIGDGPVSVTWGAMSSDSANTDRTADWEEVGVQAHSGGAGDSHAEILSRVVLRSMNAYRKTHEATYYGLAGVQTPTLVTPKDVIVRDAGRFGAKDITADWVQETTSGTWYKTNETGFSDDLVTGIDSGPGQASMFPSTTSRAAWLIQQLSNTFFSPFAKVITRTTEPIATGQTVSSVTVEAITEPLLKNDDLITIVAPNMDFYQVKLTQDQEAGATELFFDDPASPGAQYSFDTRVNSPAAIFLAEEILLAAVRLGEEAFAVTVRNSYIGQADGAQTGTITGMAVKNWLVKVRVGDSVFLDDGTELIIDGTYYPGTQNIGFQSAVVAASNNEQFWASGQVSRADFIVAQDSITATVAANRVDNFLVGELRVQMNSPGPFTELDMSPSPTDLIANSDVIWGDRVTLVNRGDDDWSSAKEWVVDEAGLSSSSPPAKRTIAVVSDTTSQVYLTGSQIWMTGRNMRQGQIKVTAAQVALNVTNIATASTQADLGVQSAAINAASIVVTDTKISALVGKTADSIGVVATGDSNDNTLTMKVNLGTAIQPGEYVYIYEVAAGTLTSLLCAAGAASGQKVITWSGSADIFLENDIVFRSIISGINIAAGTVDILNSTLRSSNYAAGSAGWQINGGGSAEFDDVTVRGSIEASTIDGSLTMNAGGEINIGSGDVVIDSSGIDVNSGEVVITGSQGLALLSGGLTSSPTTTTAVTFGGNLNTDHTASISASQGVSDTVLSLSAYNTTGAQRASVFITPFTGGTDSYIKVQSSKSTPATADIRLVAANVYVGSGGSAVGFMGAGPQTLYAITGARDNPEAALANLLSWLDIIGLINDVTTAS